LISDIARWIASAARNARSASFFCCLRVAKEGHQPVAELFQHVAAKTSHGRRCVIEISVDEVTPVLGVEPGRQTRRADEIAEHDGNRAALGRSASSSHVGEPTSTLAGTKVSKAMLSGSADLI
jgi:hypothetical protein